MSPRGKQVFGSINHLGRKIRNDYRMGSVSHKAARPDSGINGIADREDESNAGKIK
jgi:hypothetical protein